MFGVFGRKKKEGDPSLPKVVILGGGYGGVYAALELQKAVKRGQIELSLVSRDNFFLFQPMLAEVVSGSIEPPHIVNPIRQLASITNFYQAEIEVIDVESRNVAVRYPGHADFHYIPYDHLVIAVGGSTDLTALPGVAEHAFPFKTMGDALLLRDHLIGVLERAEVENDPEERRELLTFVVVGAGYTGVEVAAEIYDFVREATESYRHVASKEIKVLLLQGRDRILPELSEKLADFSHRLLERRGLEIRLNTRIKGATAQSAILSNGEVIPTSTLVAALGSAPNRLLDSTPYPRGSRGRLVVDETLSVPGHRGVWAVGDCAAIPDLRKGGTCPPTAQYALRQARHVARNIMATIKGERLRPFSYRNLGVFVPLGRYKAAAELPGFKLSGFLAWWLYRTFYLYQLPRFERKLKVMIDWTLQLFFRRDIVQIDVTRSEGISRAHYEAQEIIFRQGEPARNFYIILTGNVQVLRHQDGQDIELATLGPGEYFGEMALLRGVDRHTASVRSLSPVDLLVMGGSDFAFLARSSTRFEELLAGVMRQRTQANVAADALRVREDEPGGQPTSVQKP